ncbi:unnamed protein product [Spirodela intermedia]|uniref:Uncharacterized protein n=1 Tax=Spirodela intermedia TaxID=51605 RepID=A0A7I8L6S5_SPIIN|nr:unnamed protein product [Spirodela intermedia]
MLTNCVHQTWSEKHSYAKDKIRRLRY